jgi:hypothetical protein
MKKQYLTVVFTLTCVLGLALGASAQDADTVVANVPHNFEVGGTVLSAGSYRISRADVPPGSRQLLISNHETHESVLLIPTVFDDTQAGRAQLSFEHIGSRYFLSAVETPVGTYSITVSPTATKLAQTEQQGSSSSGTN